MALRILVADAGSYNKSQSIYEGYGLPIRLKPRFAFDVPVRVGAMVMFPLSYTPPVKVYVPPTVFANFTTYPLPTDKAVDEPAA